MRKTVVTFWLVITNLLLLSNASMAAGIIINNANYGSVVVRDGSFWGLPTGHAGVVISPLFGDSPNMVQYIIAQAYGGSSQSGLAIYAQFLESNNYLGHFKTYDTEWDSPAFRADVVKFANQAMKRSYVFLGIYSYAVDSEGVPSQDSSGHFPNQPYTGVTPQYFRCDGLAEWSIEQALGANGNFLSELLGFYPNNDEGITIGPLVIPGNGTDDSAYPLTIDSDQPSTGIVVTFSKAGIKAGVDYRGSPYAISDITSNGSTGTGGALKLLYSAGTTVTVTAPATAPNGNVFDTWWGCTTENGGTLNLNARTCTTSMNRAAHFTASYVSPSTTQTAPTVITTTATNVGSNSATLNATITNDGGSDILERRFEWNTSPSFSGTGSATNLIGATVTVSGNDFSYLLNGLASNTLYYFRPWVKNSIDWAPIPDALSFTTGSGAITVNGVCGSSNNGTFTTAPNANLCSSGSPTSVSGSGPWSWSCNGSNGGTNDNCSATNTTQAAPVITSASTASGTVNQFFSYPITATNSPTSYGASELPPGLSINTSNGMISGTPTMQGSYTVILSATNGGGTGTGTLTITTIAIYQGPGEILAVNPSDGAANQPLSVDLSWSASNTGGGALRYDVYVVQAATDNFFPNNIVSPGQTATSFPVSNLPYNTSISWGIKAIDDSGAYRYSRMFHFTTQAYTTPSTGSVSINAGAATTTSYSVMLNTTVNPPANGIRQYMRFSNDGVAWSFWQDVSQMFPWNLADPNYGGKAGLTTYTVYAQFRDDQGNQSPVYSDTIDKVAGTPGNIILNGKLFETIQDAINVANPGETVYLTEGVFTIPSYMRTPNPLRPHDPNKIVGMVLRPGVALKGAGASKTTINFLDAFYGLVDADNATIEGINLENNSTYGMRATVLLESTSSKIHNSTIRGGYDGIHVGFDSLHQAVNTQISNNLVINNQQGIFITPNASNIAIDNNTIAYNSYCGALVQDGSTTIMRNNIIAFSGYGGIGAWATTALTLGNNDFFPKLPSVDINGGITDKTGINGNISADPLFVNVSAVNYQLSAGSPAVNAGANIGVPFSGSAPDMGAFEQNATGSIQLNTNQAGASFVIAGPQGSYSGSGATWSNTNLPAGVYTISFSSLPNLYSPAYYAVELLSGQALIINANYTADTTPPVGSIAVNFEEYATDNANASLVLDVTDAVAGMGSGAQMKFSNDGVTWSALEPYSTLKKGWNLASGYGATTTSGLKTVYAMVSDALGNWATFTDTILYVPNRQVLNVPSQYSTIQAAVNAALPGDVVQIAPGNFCGNVTLLDGVTLRGSGREKTLFNCSSYIYAAANSQIEGLGGYIQINSSVGPTIIQDNSSSFGGQQVVVTGAGRRIIRNNIFHPTFATPMGIGVIVNGGSGGAEVVVENNSFINLNQALYLTSALQPFMVINRNNIFALNNTGVIDQSTNDSVHKHIYSSFNTYWANIKGNFAELDTSLGPWNLYRLMEAGDMNADPLFANVSTADFHLQAASTSINSGNPEARYTDIDLSRNDRGAYGGQRSTFTVDNMPPVVNAGGNQIKNVVFTQTATATDTSNMTYAWSKQAGPGTVTFETANALSTTISASIDGTYTIRFTATDAAGNSSFSDMTLVWDTAAPTMAIGSPSATFSKSGPVTYTVAYMGADSVTLADANVTLIKTGTANGTIAVSGTGNTARTVTISNITGDGKLGISITAGTASDVAGNQTLASGPSETFIVDNTAPVVTFTLKPAALTNLNTANFTVSADQPFTYIYKLDGNIVSDSAISGLSDGSHTLEVTAIDLAGNQSAPITYTWTVDTTAPVVKTSSPADKSTNIQLNYVLKAIFSKPMDADTINSSAFIVKAGTNVVSGSIAYDAASKSAIFTPSQLLEANKIYTAAVSTGIKDLAGNSLAANYDWTFKTVLTGDINGDASVDLADAILVLRSLSGLPAEGIRVDYAASGVDVNGDGKVGMPELLYILQKVSVTR